MKAEVYMKLLNETLVQYRNSRNSIERAESTSWQYLTFVSLENCFAVGVNNFRSFNSLNEMFNNFIVNINKKLISFVSSFESRDWTSLCSKYICGALNIILNHIIIFYLRGKGNRFLILMQMTVLNVKMQFFFFQNAFGNDVYHKIWYICNV